MGLEPIRAVARYPLKIVRLPFRHICLLFITSIILLTPSIIVKENIHEKEIISFQNLLFPRFSRAQWVSNRAF